MEGTGTFSLRVAAVIPETRDTKTFVLEEVTGKNIPYEAGQFLTFLLYHHGRELRRSFSLGSAPGIDQQLFITVKRKENGEISRFILKHWKPGTIVSSLAPSGRFTIKTALHQPRHIFFLAAGSGIVPVFSLLKKILLEEPLTHVTLIYQNHDEREIIYHKQLELIREHYPGRFLRIDLLSHPLQHDLPSKRLNNGLLEEMMNVYRPVHHRQGSDLLYTCGPPSFMRMVQFTLHVMGFAEEQLRKENFTVDPVPAPAFSIDPTPRLITVHAEEKTFQFTVSYPTTILQAALNNHIHLPYSCNAGRCGTCTAQCMQGKVTMSINEVLTEKDMEQGLVLTCVGFAETDVEIRI